MLKCFEVLREFFRPRNIAPEWTPNISDSESVVQVCPHCKHYPRQHQARGCTDIVWKQIRTIGPEGYYHVEWDIAGSNRCSCTLTSSDIDYYYEHGKPEDDTVPPADPPAPPTAKSMISHYGPT